MWLFRLIFSPVRLVLGIARLVGYSRVLVFALGVAVGLLCAPSTGAELRSRLQELVAPPPAPEAPPTV